MYQYSLQWYTHLLQLAVSNTPTQQTHTVKRRVADLLKAFHKLLFKHVCRSLFEKDKLVFSLLLSSSLAFGYDKMDPTEWRYLLTGGTDGSVCVSEAAQDVGLPQGSGRSASSSSRTSSSQRPIASSGGRAEPRGSSRLSESSPPAEGDTGRVSRSGKGEHRHEA